MIDELIYVVFPIRCLNIYAGTVIRLHFAIIGTIIPEGHRSALE